MTRSSVASSRRMRKKRRRHGGASDVDSDGDASLPSSEPERPYACDEPGCGYRAAEASTLKKHKRTHSGERPFACDEPGCEYRASEAGHLVTHKRTHSGDRPYACDEPGCEYRAAQASNLKRHKRTHSEARDKPGDARLRARPRAANTARTVASFGKLAGLVLLKSAPLLKSR
jgi:hypothetical protein